MQFIGGLTSIPFIAALFSTEFPLPLTAVADIVSYLVLIPAIALMFRGEANEYFQQNKDA